MISEEIENELEALRAIYGDDFEERPPVWKRPCFVIKVRPTTSVNGEVHVEATVKFTLVNGYPRLAPKIEVEGSRGLVASDSKALNVKLQETAALCAGQEMCHDIVTATQLFLEANNTKPQTFYEAMVSREKREVEALQKLRGKDLSNDGSRLPSAAAASRPLPTATLALELPSAGIINEDLNNKSVLESSTHDFKQSTDFITQQRKINKAKKASSKPAAAATAPVPVAEGKGPEIVSEPSQSVSTIGANSTLTSGRSTTAGPKSWLKLFINQDNDAEDPDDEGDDAGQGESSRSGSGRTGSKSRLVPVIGRPLATAAGEHNSRYWKEFIEISRLGSGASGQVWKVRNKLDRRIYAVKKIDLNAAENASVGQAKIRREVTTISRLLHKHIVRYYAAWVEETQQTGNGAGDEGEDTNVTATLTMAGGTSSNTASASSSAASSPLGKGPRRQPEYLQAVMGGYNCNFMMGDLNDELSNAYKDKHSQEWMFDETEASATAQPRKGGAAQRPVKGSRFFSYGSPSSSSSSEDSGSESSSSSSSDGDSDSEKSGSESESEGDGDNSKSSKSGDSSSNDSGSESSSESGDGKAPQSAKGIAAKNTAPGKAARGLSGAKSHAAKDSSFSKHSIPKSTAHPRLRRWMFIQMEYCFTTLREVIDQGQLWLQPAECGKLLRQLVEALAYIHDRRVIHRDLKPANIFLDAEGNIKIGDFGLATFTSDSTNTAAGQISASTSATNLHTLKDLSPMGGAEDSFFISRNASNVSLSHLDPQAGSVGSDALLSNSLTGGIGTAMYRAPEQEYRPREAGSTDRGYDDKADMFSLGVILFEMCHAPFGTGMERLITMKRLRENAELPVGFGEAFSTPALGSIVRWLVQQDPIQRPSARQLLESSLLPARVDTDSKYLKEITEALWKPNSSAAAGIISVLFSNSMNLNRGSVGPGPPALVPSGGSRASQVVDNLPAVSYDLEILQHNLNLLQPRALPRASLMNVPATATKAQKQQLRQAPQKERFVVSLQYSAAIKQQLKQVFEAHGAVSYAPGLLQLRSNPGLALMMRNADRAVASILGTSEEKTAASARSPAVAQFLDPVGQVVVLPSDLVTPFAKVVAFLNLQHSHRYNVSQVYTSLVPPDSAAAEEIGSIPSSAAASSHDHPFISEEAVYDVILPQAAAPHVLSAEGSAPASDQSVLQADFEVLTAAIEVMSSVQQYLPDCAIRVSDPRIMDAIIELCAWQLPSAAEGEAPLDKQTTSTKGIKQANSIGDLVLTVIDREALCKIISLATDGVLPVGEVLRLVSDLQLPALFLKRILPFVQVMCSQQERRAGPATATGSYLQQGAAIGPRTDPLHLLDALEQEFYRSEIIVDIQRRLASGPAPVLAAKPDKTSKPAAPEPAAAPSVPAVSDFTPLNLGHIGKQQAKKKDLAVPTPTVPAAAPATTAPKAEDPFREDRKRIRAIIKTFDSSINHLRQLVKGALNCMYGIQQFSSANQPHGTQNGTDGSSALILLVDLGKDPRYISSRAGSSMLCPFHARGVYFVIESYLFPSEQFLQQQQQAQQSKQKDKAGASGAVDPELAFRCSRRRHNRFGGVLGEGGHFEHLVETYRDHFQMVSGDSGAAEDKRARSKVVACALRLKPDAIASLVSKYEARQKKITEHLLSRGSSTRYFFVERFKPDLARLLDSNPSLDVLLALDTTSNNGNGLRSKEEANTNVGILHSVLLLLRRHGIRVSDRPHQLHGATRGFGQLLDSSAVATLCGELGIPFAVTIQADAHNKFVLQYCGETAAPEGPQVSTGAQHQSQSSQTNRSVTVSLLDLPKLLAECIKALRAADKRKFSFPAVVSSFVGDSSPVARSPGRQASSAAGNITAASGDLSAAGVSATAGSNSGASGASAGAASASGSGKNQKVRFGSFDIKNPSSTPGASSEAADGSAASASSASTPGRSEKMVHIVIMEAGGGGGGAAGSSQGGGHSKDWQQYGNPKEKKQAMVKKKELEQVPNRVRSILVGQLMMLYPGAEAALPVTISTMVRSLGSAYTPGQVLAVEAPFLMLRGLNTILMTRLHSAMTSALAREECDALAAGAYADSATGPGAYGVGPTGGNYRKVLKQVIVQLLTYAKQVSGVAGSTVTPSAGGSQAASKASGAAATSTGGGSAGAPSSATPMLQLYLYSVADNQMDLLCCDAKALLNAKLS